MRKVYNLGFRGPISELLKRYLGYRCQYVEKDGRNSKLQEIKTGVPQGSVLGPFLILLYYNDLPEICGNDADIALFAGDTSPIKKGNELQQI